MTKPKKKFKITQSILDATLSGGSLSEFQETKLSQVKYLIHMTEIFSTGRAYLPDEGEKLEKIEALLQELKLELKTEWEL